MARSSNKVADDLLTSARDSAVHDGLRLAVPQYLGAVDALVAEDRKDEARGVLAEMLAAKEKKRGFLFAKREQSALGDQRQAVAVKYAQVVLGLPPTEESLETLGQLAVEFPDEIDIRLANARALADAGYLLDALDEYTYCGSHRADDADIPAAIAVLLTRLGRTADAAAAFAKLSSQTLAAHRSDLAAAVELAVQTKFENEDARAATVSQLRSACDSISDAALASRLDAIAPKPVEPSVAEPAPAAAVTASEATPPSPAPPSPAPSASAAETTPAQPQAPPAAAPQTDGVAAATPQVRRPAAGGLSAFAKRKAFELFANSEYEAAAVQLERVVKMSPDVEALEMLLECYLVLERHSEAARTGVQLADAELAAGNRPGAIATLTTLSKKIADPNVEQRRVELMRM